MSELGWSSVLLHPSSLDIKASFARRNFSPKIPLQPDFLTSIMSI